MRSTGWPLVPLMDLCSPKQWPTIPQTEFTETGFPVYGANGQIGYYSEFNHEKPTVLITCRGATCGTINVCAERSYVTGNSMALDDLDESRVDLRFLVYALQNGSLSKAISGTAQPQITRQGLAAISIPIPPLREQRRIAQILDKADALRGKRRAALSQLDTLRRSAFRDMFGDLRGDDRRWPTVPLDGIVRETKLGLVRGSAEFGPDLPIPYVRMNAITRSGDLDLSDVQGTRATDAEIEACRLEPGDFLFNTRNSKELVGKTALYRGGGLHLFNNNIMRIRFTGDAEPEFVAAAFKTAFVEHELDLRKSGTTNVFAIYYKDLRTLPLPLPPIALQRDFARKVAAVERLRVTQRRSLAALDALFSTLQYRVFRGDLAS